MANNSWEDYLDQMRLNTYPPLRVQQPRSQVKLIGITGALYAASHGGAINTNLSDYKEVVDWRDKFHNEETLKELCEEQWMLFGKLSKVATVTKEQLSYLTSQGYGKLDKGIVMFESDYGSIRLVLDEERTKKGELADFLEALL